MKTFVGICLLLYHTFFQNILLRVRNDNDLTGVVGDFGLASRSPRPGERLAQVGSPYWMSPECLKGIFYDGKVGIYFRRISKRKGKEDLQENLWFSELATLHILVLETLQTCTRLITKCYFPNSLTCSLSA
jgi:serine/threonine protein kinase